MLTASTTRHTVGKTFSIAISALGVGTLLQLGIIVWAFATRPADAMASLGTNPGAFVRQSTPPPSTPDFTQNLFSEPPQTLTTTTATTPAPTVPHKPTPAPQTAPPAEPVNRFEEVVLQGKQLRERGDLNTALIKFREAGTMDPKNPIAIAELAATYEKLGAADRAGEQWRKIYDMGDAAGVYFSLADAKLKATQALATREAAAKVPVEPAADTTAVEGIATGATLGLLPVRAEDEPDPNSATRFSLHIPIKARPKTKMDVRDLVIHVLFYDIVDGQNVVQTSANVNSRWMTPPADWLEADTEELAVEYQLPKPEAKAAKRENRKYFGYIVRIYYKQQLQAAAAEPERLAQQYPPPPTLPKDPDK